MNRPIRKLLAWTLALIMLIGMMPVDAVAAIIKTDTSNAVKIGDVLPGIRSISPVEATHTYEFQVPKEDGTGFEPWGTQIVKNNGMLLEPSAPVLANKKFTGWTGQDELGNSVPINFGVTITVNPGDTKTITATAQFTDVVYVRFINTDEDKVILTKELLPGDTTDANNVPLIPPDGKGFQHWSATEGGPAFDFSTPINDNTNLYSVFVNQHAVTFMSHGGSAVSPAYVNSGGTVSAPTPPTRTGYNFVRWSTDVDGTIAYDFETAVTENLTLHAVWTAKTDVKYRVVHWQQNAEDDEYVVADYEDKTGTAGQNATYMQKNYTGFEFGSSDDVTIKGDGSTVVNVYYNRKVYNLTIETGERQTSWPWDWKWTTYSTTQFRYGQSTAPAYNAAVAEYPYYSWYITKSSDIAYSEAPAMPNSNLTVHGRYAGTSRYVIHYVEKGTTTNIKPDYVFYGDTGLKFTVEDGIDIPGFTVTPLSEWEP